MQDAMEEARLYAGVGDYSAAELLFEEARKNGERTVDFHIGFCRAQLGAHATAIESFNRQMRVYEARYDGLLRSSTMCSSPANQLSPAAWLAYEAPFALIFHQRIRSQERVAAEFVRRQRTLLERSFSYCADDTTAWYLLATAYYRLGYHRPALECIDAGLAADVDASIGVDDDDSGRAAVTTGDATSCADRPMDGDGGEAQEERRVFSTPALLALAVEVCRQLGEPQDLVMADVYADTLRNDTAACPVDVNAGTLQHSALHWADSSLTVDASVAEAQAHIDEVLSQSPRCTPEPLRAGALVWRGNLHLALGQVSKASTAFREVAALVHKSTAVPDLSRLPFGGAVGATTAAAGSPSLPPKPHHSDSLWMPELAPPRITGVHPMVTVRALQRELSARRSTGEHVPHSHERTFVDEAVASAAAESAKRASAAAASGGALSRPTAFPVHICIRRSLEAACALYTEVIVRYGPAARAYWYRANVRKLLGDWEGAAVDVELMHRADSRFLRAYLLAPPSGDYCDPNTLSWLQINVLMSVYVHGAVHEWGKASDVKGAGESSATSVASDARAGVNTIVTATYRIITPHFPEPFHLEISEPKQAERAVAAKRRAASLYADPHDKTHEVRFVRRRPELLAFKLQQVYFREVLAAGVLVCESWDDYCACEADLWRLQGEFDKATDAYAKVLQRHATNALAVAGQTMLSAHKFDLDTSGDYDTDRLANAVAELAKPPMPYFPDESEGHKRRRGRGSRVGSRLGSRQGSRVGSRVGSRRGSRSSSRRGSRDTSPVTSQPGSRRGSRGSDAGGAAEGGDSVSTNKVPPGNRAAAWRRDEITMRLLHETAHIVPAADVPVRKVLNADRDRRARLLTAALNEVGGGIDQGDAVAGATPRSPAREASSEARWLVARTGDLLDWRRRRLIAILLSCRALLFVLQGHPAPARALLQRALVIDNDCSFAHNQLFWLYMRFDSVAACVMHLDACMLNNFFFVVGVPTVYFSFIFDPTYAPALAGVSGAGSSDGAAIMPLVSHVPQPNIALIKQHTAYRPANPNEWGAEQWYKEGLGMLAVGYGAEVSLCFKHAVAIEPAFLTPLNEALREIESNRDVQTHDHASEYIVVIVGEINLSLIVWEMYSRGKYFDQLAFYECGYADLAYSLRLARLGDIYWRRALLSLRQANLTAARSDILAAVAATREEQASEPSTDAASPVHAVLAKKLETYLHALSTVNYNLADYQATIDDTTQVIKMNPENWQCFRLRSLAHAKTGKLASALADLEKYTRKNPDDMGALLRLANLQTHMKDYVSAIKGFNHIVQLSPSSAQALYGRGLVYFRQQQWSLALSDFDAALTKVPDFWAACLRLGEVHERLGDVDKALVPLRHVIECDPYFPQASLVLGRVLLGVAHTRMSRVMKATARMRELERLLGPVAMEEVAADIRCRLNTGSSRRASPLSSPTLTPQQPPGDEVGVGKFGLLDGSRPLSSKTKKDHDAPAPLVVDSVAIERQTEYVDLRCDVVDKLVREVHADVIQAVPLLERAIRMENTADAHFLLGYARFMSAETRDIETIGPVEPVVSYRIGGTTMDLYRSAISSLTRSIILAPHHTRALFLRGFLHMRRHCFEEAYADFMESLRHESGNMWALTARAFIHFHRRQPDLAMRAYTWLVQDNPTLGLAYSNRALIHLQGGNYSDAIGDLNRALELDPHDVHALMLRAECNKLLHDHDDAITDYMAAIPLLLGPLRVQQAKVDFLKREADLDKKLRDRHRETHMQFVAGEADHFKDRRKVVSDMPSDDEPPTAEELAEQEAEAAREYELLDVGTTWDTVGRMHNSLGVLLYKKVHHRRKQNTRARWIDTAVLGGVDAIAEAKRAARRENGEGSPVAADDSVTTGDTAGMGGAAESPSKFKSMKWLGAKMRKQMRVQVAKTKTKMREMQAERQLEAKRNEILQSFLTASTHVAHPAVQYNVGVIHLDNNDLNSAHKALKAAVEGDGELPDAWNNYGVVLERLGRTDEAAIAYEKAYEEDPTHALACFNFANIKVVLHQYREAIQLYSLLIKRALQDMRETQTGAEPITRDPHYTTQHELAAAGHDASAEELSEDLEAELEKMETSQADDVDVGDEDDHAHDVHKDEDSESEDGRLLGGPASPEDREAAAAQHRSAISRRILPFALNNRAICYQHLNQFRLAEMGYALTIEVEPLALIAYFNRAHLLMSRGYCHTAIRDVRHVQRYKRTEYLRRFLEFCKRYQWGLSSTCRDLVGGISIMPAADRLDTVEAVLPVGLFDPDGLRFSASDHYVRLLSLMRGVLRECLPEECARAVASKPQSFPNTDGNSDEPAPDYLASIDILATIAELKRPDPAFRKVALASASTLARDFLISMRDAIVHHIAGEEDAAFRSLVCATYFIPKSSDRSNVWQDLREIVATWRARLQMKRGNVTGALADLGSAVSRARRRVGASAVMAQSMMQDMRFAATVSQRSHAQQARALSSSARYREPADGTTRSLQDIAMAALSAAELYTDGEAQAPPTDFQRAPPPRTHIGESLLGAQITPRQRRETVLLTYMGCLYQSQEPPVVADAVAAYDHALAVDPLNIVALWNLGNLYREHGFYKDSLESFWRVVEYLAGASARLPAAERKVYDLLAEYRFLVNKDMQSTWSKIAPLVGQLVMVIDEIEYQRRKGRDRRAHEEVEMFSTSDLSPRAQFDKAVSAYTTHLLDAADRDVDVAATVPPLSARERVEEANRRSAADGREAAAERRLIKQYAVAGRRIENMYSPKVAKSEEAAAAEARTAAPLNNANSDATSALREAADGDVEGGDDDEFVVSSVPMSFGDEGGTNPEPRCVEPVSPGASSYGHHSTRSEEIGVDLGVQARAASAAQKRRMRLDQIQQRFRVSSRARRVLGARPATMSGARPRARRTRAQLSARGAPETAPPESAVASSDVDDGVRDAPACPVGSQHVESTTGVVSPDAAADMETERFKAERLGRPYFEQRREPLAPPGWSVADPNPIVLGSSVVEAASPETVRLPAVRNALAFKDDRANARAVSEFSRTIQHIVASQRDDDAGVFNRDLVKRRADTPGGYFYSHAAMSRSPSDYKTSIQPAL